MADHCNESNLRFSKKTGIYIEEDHNDVLRHIFRAVGAKFLRVANNILVHFDSHPDLGLPHSLRHEDTESASELLEKLSIENWILPAAYLGLISTIVWICPPWANQIPEGRYTFHIGRHQVSGEIMLTCIESYFLSEGVTCNETELDNSKEITLIVYRLAPEGPVENHLFQMVSECVRNSPNYILDIDLDFYSTKNPFLDLFPRANLYERLKSLYTFETVPNFLPDDERRNQAAVVGQKRKLLLDKLADLTDYLEENRSVDGYSGHGQEYVEQMRQIQRAIVAQYQYETQIDWTIVHNAGCTCDDTDLPHHISTPTEISQLVRQTHQVLGKLGGRVALVTIARSSRDDYCPPDQVDEIQNGVLGFLSDLYGRDQIEIKRCYEDDDDA